MTVGMTTSLSLLVDKPALIIGSALILMLVKSMSLTAIARIKILMAQQLMLAVCLAQGGEFAFVILKVASSEKVITQAVSEPLTLIVTLSMVLTPIAYWLVSRWIIPLIDPEQAPVYDEIPDSHNPMIIAGFGRFGQTIADTHLQHQPFTAIDSSIDSRFCAQLWRYAILWRRHTTGYFTFCGH